MEPKSAAWKASAGGIEGPHWEAWDSSFWVWAKAQASLDSSSEYKEFAKNMGDTSAAVLAMGAKLEAIGAKIAPVFTAMGGKIGVTQVMLDRGYVAVALNMVKRRWQPGELEKLTEALNKIGVKEGRSGL